MRNIASVLLPLGLLAFSVGTAAADNVCVHAADGAIVCGPVAQSITKPTPSPFDQPQSNVAPPSVAQPSLPAPPPAAAPPRPAPSRHVRQAERAAPPPPPKHTVRRPPPREFDQPPRRIVREDARRRVAEHYAPPPRYSDRRRIDDRRDPVMARIEADRRYDARLRELEREIRALRAERERYLPPPRLPKRVARDRYSSDE